MVMRGVVVVIVAGLCGCGAGRVDVNVTVDPSVKAWAQVDSGDGCGSGEYPESCGVNGKNVASITNTAQGRYFVELLEQPKDENYAVTVTASPDLAGSDFNCVVVVGQRVEAPQFAIQCYGQLAQHAADIGFSFVVVD